MHPSSSSTSKSQWTKTSIIFTFVCILFLFVPFVVSLPKNETAFRPMQELKKLKRIRTHLKKINKPSIKTIQAFFFIYFFINSPDGDLIDCVLSHLQPAFDHPKLKGQKPLEPPLEMPNGHNSSDESTETFQLWAESSTGFCPQGSVPIRRTTEKDVLRASSLRRFGRKIRGGVRHDTMSGVMNLSQLWVISGSFGNDLNTVEAGWQVSPELYGDGYPRFFTYWTVRTINVLYHVLGYGYVMIAIGAAISPRSSYKGKQFDIGIMIWKDPKHGHWWLQFGSGLLIGYWPSFLFSHLQKHASMIQFGGEIVNSRSRGYHTSTQMGSGHFADEGFGKASYFRNLKVVDWDNSLLPLTNLHLLADHPNCYDIKAGKNNVWGNYIYYGGPGKNGRCQ
ncbi:hypothetical protein OSB04_004340 [Centaurea solstitialis]|uniref:Neprosin PEP catalytic domain-containing protein n=1 Tax=Centaurea solstitialis TaxID=347529 RepID=A0AA38TYC8_9ASTR|nr:hypothetical protein OSB04_004340 [Centaurea solstitialis]